ncbi:hypothetical protein [Acidimangrovimonas pyrenivorans]|uniref:Uncharacterized protein n=1 Tax=Acidimangrovimonas pyrenivorans TaxID=2030798 RepID=A0ABV7ALZ0_9RHOB
MADPNLADFHGRLRRIDKIRRKGGGFEAEGTLGRSHFAQSSRRRFPILGPILVVALAVTGLKAVIHARIGSDLYAARVTELQAGAGIDKAGAFIMHPDPITLYLSRKLRRALR